MQAAQPLFTRPDPQHLCIPIHLHSLTVGHCLLARTLTAPHTPAKHSPTPVGQACAMPDHSQPTDPAGSKQPHVQSPKPCTAAPNSLRAPNRRDRRFHTPILCIQSPKAIKYWAPVQTPLLGNLIHSDCTSVTVCRLGRLYSRCLHITPAHQHTPAVEYHTWTDPHTFCCQAH